MIRFIGLLIFIGVFRIIMLSFDDTKPIDLTTTSEEQALKRRQIIPASSFKKPPHTQQHKSSLHKELTQGLKLTKVDGASSRVIIDAIIEANSILPRSFPVDEAAYDQEGEPEQPLQALNEQDMARQMALAGLSAEQNQAIIDGIAEANLGK